MLDKSLVLILCLLLHHHSFAKSTVSESSGGNYGNGSWSHHHVFKCMGRLHDSGETSVDVPAHFMSDDAPHSFPLKRKELNCKKGRFKVLFQFPLVQKDDSSGEIRAPVAKVLETDPKTRKTVSHKDASVKIMRDGAYLRIASDFFHPEEYCFDQIDSGEMSLFVCYPECYGQRPCVTKCCAQDEVWDVLNKKCVKSDKGNGTTRVWKPWLFSRSVDNCVKRVTTYHRDQISIHIQQRLPECDPTEYQPIPLRKIHDYAFQRFRVLWTGTVIMRDKYGNWSEFSPGRFCVDGMVNFGHGSSHYSGGFSDQVVLACPDQVPPSYHKKPIPLRYAVMLLVAAAILLVTALISGLLWDRQNVYEWTVFCEVIAMFFMILFVGIAHTIARRPEKSDFGSAHCVFIGAVSHFFWLATFCWLFIINFEIWWNFRSLVQLRQSRKWFRFSVYQLVGWGCPLVAVGVGLLLDRTWGLQNEDLDCTNLIVPNYGQLNCYIAKSAQGPYLFYPIGVILGCNLVFYLLTVCKMWGYQKKSQEIIQYRSRGQTQPILIFAKLFIVMGVSWVFEIVSWGITSQEVDRIPLYWVIFDIVTLFQAISIFVIFVWKKQVLSRLWYKYPSCKPLLKPLTKLPGCGLLANDRDRLVSLHNTHSQSPNKLPRGSSAHFTTRQLAPAAVSPEASPTNNNANHHHHHHRDRPAAEQLADSSI